MRRIALLAVVVVILVILCAYLFLPGGPLSADAQCAQKVGEWEEHLKPQLEEWYDLFNLASSTSRIALSPVVREMQSVRREVAAAEAPECAREAKLHLLSMMESTIDAFTLFMEQESDSAIATKMEDAAQAASRYRREVESLKKLPPSTIGRWRETLERNIRQLMPASELPRSTYINGYDPKTGARLETVAIVDREGAVVAQLEHGDPITVTKIEGPNCFVVTEAGVKGMLACDYVQ